jgi:hypothetical protein
MAVIVLPDAWAQVIRHQCAPPCSLSSLLLQLSSPFTVVEDGSEEEPTEMIPSVGTRTGTARRWRRR